MEKFTIITKENDLVKNKIDSSLEVKQEMDDGQYQKVSRKEQSLKRRLNKGCDVIETNANTAKMMENIDGRAYTNLTDYENKMYGEYLSKSVDKMTELKILHQQDLKISLNKTCGERIPEEPNRKTAKMIENIAGRVNPNLADDEEKVYPCAYCEYLSKTVEEMTEHRILHQQEHKPHKCDRCGFSCREASTLKLHRLVHVPDKPFVCDVCGFKAKLMYLLTKHKVVHSEKKPYACNECSYTAKWLTNLRAHKKSHEKEPLYNCDTCKFTCRHAEVIEEHKQRHKVNS